MTISPIPWLRAERDERGVVDLTSTGPSGLEGFCSGLREHIDAMQRSLAHHGWLVIRGLNVDSPERLSAVATALKPLDSGYLGGGSPRKQLGNAVYESTRLPASFRLQTHQEMAYLPKYPQIIVFACFQPAQKGGHTTVANVRSFMRLCEPRLSEVFGKRRIRYVRNLAAGEGGSLAFLHRPWREVLGSADAAQAERNAHDLGLGYRWETDGSITVMHDAGLFTQHPLSGDRLWFNHLLFQHANRFTMGSVYNLFQRRLALNGHMPFNVVWDDGSEIDFGDLAELYEAFGQAEQGHAWETGDLMIVDNVLCTHGRTPYEGTRLIGTSLCNWH